MNLIVRRMTCPDCGDDSLRADLLGAYNPESCGAVVVSVPDVPALRLLQAQDEHEQAERELRRVIGIEGP